MDVGVAIPTCKEGLGSPVGVARPDQVIEVLDAAQFDKFHLPGAINIPFNDQFETAIIAAVPNRNDKIVVYCSGKTSDASTKAAAKLTTLGYTRVRDFKEGKKAWQEAASA